MTSPKDILLGLTTIIYTYQIETGDKPLEIVLSKNHYESLREELRDINKDFETEYICEGVRISYR